MDMLIDGSVYTLTFTGFKMQMDSTVVYYENATVTLNESNNDLSTAITGYYTDGSDRMDFKDYAVILTGDNLTLDGLVKTSCIGAWIEVKTIQPLVMPGFCPTAGEISIIGNGSNINMVFNADESVDVTLNGEAYNSYNSCDELPSSDVVCS